MLPDHLPEDDRINVYDSETLRRLITNQKRERKRHAFRAGCGGMEMFNHIFPILRSMSRNELSLWAKLIDEVCLSYLYCLPCCSKARAYLILITKDILPGLHQFHLQRYQLLIKRRAHDRSRDFMIEVIDSLYQEPNHLEADVYRAWWKHVSENALSS